MKLQNTTPKQIHSSTLHSLALFSVIFLLCQCSSASAHLSNQTDQLALLEFKHQIANNPVFNLWNTSLHFCQWKGVECGHRHHRVIGLNLTGQNMFGTISPHIGNLSFLRFINLQDNHFHGEIPQQISYLYRLRHLNLTNNILGGPLPVNLSCCFNFRGVYLGDNHLVGMIPVELGSLKKLSLLDLDSNNLTGLIPTSFGNLSSLTQISLAANNIKGTIPSELGRLRNLVFIGLGENNLTGRIPSSLFNISTITEFWTSSNRLTGTLPTNIGLTLPNLQVFGIGINNFRGEIPGSFSNASQLKFLEMASNMFTGQVPANLGSLQNLFKFNIEDNLLGTNATDNLSFITSLSNCTNLKLLGLQSNNFGGEIPSSIGNLSVHLNGLALGYNQISGIIPAAIESLSNLYILDLENNLLSGPIPNSLGKLRNLQVLLLNGNKLRGQIPSSLGNITVLYALDLSDNKLEGNIPASIGNCEKLNLLDLSQNNLIGPIPYNVVSIFSLSISLNLSKNSLTGSLPVEVGRLKNINALDVSNNKFTGNFPETIAACLIIEYLYIQGNFFQGIIPSALAALKGIRELDLSRNNFSGEIPEDMEKLPYLHYLNLSFNELEGKVPKKGAFGNASAISILGNSKLCGGIEELKLPSCRIKVKKPRRHLAFKVVIIASGVALLFVLIIIFIFLRSRRRRKTRKDPASLDSTLKRLLRISYHELYRATAGFSPQNLIGSGSFGSVYKGKLNPREEKLVAVKVLNLQKSGASKSFVTECRALRNIRHRNLVKILTYCSSIDFKGNEFKALVYKFMANRSLDMWLHPQVPGSSTALNLIQRLNLAIDVASAIHYLHDFSEPPIIHCDLKPSNILLDDDLTAHVGDFGLARLLSNSADTFAQAQSSSMGIKGSIGYVAPEYGMGGAASKCGDVYSYGVLLLELFTGTRPTDDMFKDGLNLHNYIKMGLQEQGMQIVDQTLLEIGETGETEAAIVEGEREAVNEIEVEQYTINTGNLFHGSEKLQNCIIAVLEIGLACSVESPNQRMGMNDILRELHHIKTAFLDDGISINRSVLDHGQGDDEDVQDTCSQDGPWRGIGEASELCLKLHSNRFHLLLCHINSLCLDSLP
ncbi:hypothetical protein LguiB_021124 [Lonicera macranthoides]